MSAETAATPAATTEKPEVTNAEQKEEGTKAAEVGEKRKAEDDAGAEDKK
jgi:hypothetical protein